MEIQGEFRNSKCGADDSLVNVVLTILSNNNIPDLLTSILI
jgi:hypothetical protein